MKSELQQRFFEDFWGNVNVNFRYKIMDPLSIIPPQNLRRIFVATLSQNYPRVLD